MFENVDGRTMGAGDIGLLIGSIAHDHSALVTVAWLKVQNFKNP